MRYLTWNVHGSVDRNGNGNGGNWGALWPELSAAVNTHDPDAIGLQELCAKQYNKFRTELAKLGYKAIMGVARNSGGCGTDQGFGNALFFKTSLLMASTYELSWGANPVGSTGREPRVLIIGKVPYRRSNVVYAVTHLSPHDPDKATQMGECLAAIAANQGSTPSRVVFMGDFNMSASALSGYLPGWNIESNTIDHVASNLPLGVKIIIPSVASDHDILVAGMDGVDPSP